MARNRILSSSTVCRMFRLPVAIVVILAGFTSQFACAQGHPAPTSASTPGKTNSTNSTPPVVAKTTKRPVSKPTWSELTPAQQQALTPLAGEWDRMEANRKEKWLVIGNKFASMHPTEQERMQERMRDWVKLTPAQRRSVRESYVRAKKLDAEKKSAQWQQYQQLSEEQKKKLAQAKLPKHVAVLPTGKGKAAPSIQLPQEALEQPAPASPAALVTPAENR
jgi:hypothetical protein